MLLCWIKLFIVRTKDQNQMFFKYFIFCFYDNKTNLYSWLNGWSIQTWWFGCTTSTQPGGMQCIVIAGQDESHILVIRRTHTHYTIFINLRKIWPNKHQSHHHPWHFSQESETKLDILICHNMIIRTIRHICNKSQLNIPLFITTQHMNACWCALLIY